MSFGEVDVYGYEDSFVFYPDRAEMAQMGDIVDMWRTSSGNVRDAIENVQNKTVSESRLIARRKWNTGDSSQDIIYTCDQDVRWTWSYGTINFNSVSNFTLSNPDSFGYFFVYGTCRSPSNNAISSLLSKFIFAYLLYAFY